MNLGKPLVLGMNLGHSDILLRYVSRTWRDRTVKIVRGMRDALATLEGHMDTLQISRVDISKLSNGKWVARILFSDAGSMEIMRDTCLEASEWVPKAIKRIEEGTSDD